MCQVLCHPGTSIVSVDGYLRATLIGLPLPVCVCIFIGARQATGTTPYRVTFVTSCWCRVAVVSLSLSVCACDTLSSLFISA